MHVELNNTKSEAQEVQLVIKKLHVIQLLEQESHVRVMEFSTVKFIGQLVEQILLIKKYPILHFEQSVFEEHI